MQHDCTCLIYLNPRRQGGNEMKSFRKELWYEIPTRRGFINITPQVDTRPEAGVKLQSCNLKWPAGHPT